MTDVASAGTPDPRLPPPPPPPAANGRAGWALTRFGPVLVALLFGGALWVLHRELARYRYRDVLHTLEALPRTRLLLAIALTVLAYLALTGYDHLALRYVRSSIGRVRTTFTAFIAYSFSNTLGVPLLTGGSVRYRLYSAWGLAPADIAQAIAFSAVTFWLGLLSVAGVSYLAVPTAQIASAGLPPAVLRGLSVIALAAVAAYVVWATRRRRPLVVRGIALAAPGPRLAGAQVALSVLDWVLAAVVLYVLLPVGHGVSLLGFLGLFVLAQTAGLASHVPGGLGVFEAVLIVTLGGEVPGAALLGSLLAYRVVYYLIPFALGASLLVGYEVAQRRAMLARTAGAVARAGSAAVPAVVSAATFLAGLVLLISGATPAVSDRLGFLDRLLPLSVIEVSHFLGSLIGLALLFLARGLRARLDIAYQLTVGLLCAGAVASLLKGLDYEEALVLVVVLSLLLAAREHFHRRASLTAERPTPGWIAAVAMALVATMWLGLFAYKHVEYSGELWWQFALRADAPRFLRATVGMLVALGALGAWRLLAPAPGRPVLPGPAEIERAAAVIAASPVALANLALTGDKALLFAPDGRGFIMYAVCRRSWVVMGDPVGPAEVQEDLAWRFRELADRHGGSPAFYQVSAELLPLYLDLGLTPLKLGEEARVPLATFSLDGPDRRALRRGHRAVEHVGCAFSLVDSPGVAALVPELGRVSDAWLATMRAREKGFSLGRFDPAYVSRGPVALARREGELLAFATLWSAAGRAELSVDLMRHVPQAPAGVMDYLFVELMLWGRAQGYQSFNLGMAPLSGLENRTFAPLWNRLNALVYRHAEYFYHFQGLRQYKEKFRPEWAPKYLASPGGFAVPRILADVTTLISGGLRGAVGK